MNTTLLLLLVLLSDESVREKFKPIFSLLSDPQTLSLLSSLSDSKEPAKREEAKEGEQKKETSDPEEVSLWLQRIMNSRQ